MLARRATSWCDRGVTSPDDTAKSSAARAEPGARPQTGANASVKAWVSLDAAALRGIARPDPQRDASDLGEAERLGAHAAEAWDAIARAVPPSDHALSELERNARRLGMPDLVIEAAVLRALSWAHAGELDEALACARRAFRMGRTERLPESEHLAALVLARLRRATGHPYLATRIATALRRFVPSAWHPWIDWEITMSSGTAPNTATGPAVVLRQLLAHARAGDRGAFAATLDELRACTHAFAPLAADVRLLHAAIDPLVDPHEAAPDIAGQIAKWCRGESPFDPPPLGLSGLDGPAAGDPTTTGVAFVVAHPQRTSRRVLRIAAALAVNAGASAALTEGRVGRAEGIVSALALAGREGLPETDLFRAVYGFSYVPALHRGAFDVALHRARARSGDLGTIERGDGWIRLAVQVAFVVPDPRSAPATEDRVLGRLARAGEVSAKELAQVLAMPLRTVQDSLRSLVEAGACIQHRAGRRVVYALEDTTFQEPTRA
jgi:hypothetical protein